MIEEENKRYLLAAGVLILALVFYGMLRETHQPELRKVTIKLQDKPTLINNSRGYYDFKIKGKEHCCFFYVPKGRLSQGFHKKVAEMNGENYVTLTVDSNEFNVHKMDCDKVIVYGIQYKNENLLTGPESLENDEQYNTRIRIIGLFIGLLLILNGLKKPSSRFNVIVISVFLLSLLVMHYFEVILY